MNDIPIPRGIEILVKKASVDPTFKNLLLSERAAAADEIALTLEPAEAAMLNAVPAAQLESIIARTRVTPRQRPAFLGKAAAAMIVALGVGIAGCDRQPVTEGIRPEPDDKDQAKQEQPEDEAQPQPSDTLSRGIRPDTPPPTGIRPDEP